MSPLTLTTILVCLPLMCSSEPIQDIRYDQSPQLFNLLFSEKFPPTRGRTSMAHVKEEKSMNKQKKLSSPSVTRKIISPVRGTQKFVAPSQAEKEQTTFERIKTIIRNFKLAFYDFVDVTLIRSFVDLAVNGMSPSKRIPIKGRSDLKVKRNESLKRMMTYVLAGLMDKQSCRYRTLCELGNLIQPVKGKAVIFLIFETIVPKSWKGVRAAIEVFKSGSLGRISCDVHQCSELRPTIVERL